MTIAGVQEIIASVEESLQFEANSLMIPRKLKAGTTSVPKSIRIA